MIPRALAALAVVGAGAALGSWAARRAGREAGREGEAPTATGPDGTLRRRVEEALAEGRRAAALREAELREEFGMTAPGTGDDTVVRPAAVAPASAHATTGTNRPAQSTG